MLYIIREASGECRLLHNGVEIEGFWRLDYKSVQADTAVEITLTTILSKDVRIIEKKPDFDQMFGKKPKERTKPKFYIEDYKGKFVMHCEEEWQAEKFCEFLHNQGKKWANEVSYAKENCWDEYRTETCYKFYAGAYSSLPFYKKEGYTILEFDNFDWEE